MNKEAEKLLKSIKVVPATDDAEGVTCCKMRVSDYVKIDQALAILKEQPPAGDLAKESIELDKMCVSEIVAKYESSHNAITVLKRKFLEACTYLESKEQPPASDFTKEVRLLYELRPKVIEGKIVAKHIFGLCTRLDRSEAGERILEERIEKLSDTLDRSEASREELLTALEEASSDFYYIHRHSEDAHVDSYNFMEKAKKAIKQGECGEKERKLCKL